jgi:hypothetical protein
MGTVFLVLATDAQSRSRPLYQSLSSEGLSLTIQDSELGVIPVPRIATNRVVQSSIVPLKATPILVIVNKFVGLLPEGQCGRE